MPLRSKSHVVRAIAQIFIIVLFLTPYLFGWNWGWWKFLPSTVGIILLWYWAEPASATRDLGINFKPRDLYYALLLLTAVHLIANSLITKVLGRHGYLPGPGSQHYGRTFLSVFQVANEEMILRAGVLGSIGLVVKKPQVTCVVGAALFAFAHTIFYAGGDEGIQISTKAIATLFLTGVACNALYFIRGNISLAYALHLGWNITRFGNDWVARDTGLSLGEGESFNLVEGNLNVMALSILMALVSVLVWRKKLGQSEVG